MTRAKVVFNLIDRSYSFESQAGLAVGSVIPALRGPLVPTLVESGTDLMDKFAKTHVYSSEDDPCLFNAVQTSLYTNRHWVVRAQNGAKYAGYLAAQASSESEGQALSSYVTNPDIIDLSTKDGRQDMGDINITFDKEGMFTFNAEDTTNITYDELVDGGACRTLGFAGGGQYPAPFEEQKTYYLHKFGNGKFGLAETKEAALQGIVITPTNAGILPDFMPERGYTFQYKATDDQQEVAVYFFADMTGNAGTVSKAAWDQSKIGDVVKFTSSDLPEPLVADKEYFLIKKAATGKIAFAETAQYAENDVELDITGNITTPVTYQNQSTKAVAENEQPLFAVVSKDPGAWGNTVKFKVVPYSENPTLIENPNFFQILVIEEGGEQESFIVSRDPDSRDSSNMNNYIETIMKASKYVDIIDNKLIDKTVMPKANSQWYTLGGGDDGLAVTDAQMIEALQLLDQKKYRTKKISDAGWTTTMYRNALAQFCAKNYCLGYVNAPASLMQGDAFNNVRDWRLTGEGALNSIWLHYTADQVQVYDPVADRDIWLPASASVCGLKAYYGNIDEGAPVSLENGVLTNIKGLMKTWSDDEMDLLSDCQINTIALTANGYNLQELKTAQTKLTDLSYDYAVASIIYLIDNIRPQLNGLNTKITQDTLMDLLYKVEVPFMDAKARNMINTYTVRLLTDMLEADLRAKRARLKGSVSITPLFREINFTLEVTPYQLNFTIAE